MEKSKHIEVTETSLIEIVKFLAEHAWIYNFQVTRLFTEEIWKYIPQQWEEFLLQLTSEELNGIPFGKYQESWPESFQRFVKKCLHFSVCRTAEHNDQYTVLQDSEIPDDIKRGMAAKKLHEVCHMTSLIDHVTAQAGSNAVVDVGSGLGYLGQILHLKYGWPVLGLESKQCHTSGADKRVTGTGGCCSLQNATCELKQDTESRELFKSSVNKWFSGLSLGGSTCSHVTKNKPVMTEQNTAKKHEQSSECLVPSSDGILSVGLVAARGSEESNQPRAGNLVSNTETYLPNIKCTCTCMCKNTHTHNTGGCYNSTCSCKVGVRSAIQQCPEELKTCEIPGSICEKRPDDKNSKDGLKGISVSFSDVSQHSSENSGVEIKTCNRLGECQMSKSPYDSVCGTTDVREAYTHFDKTEYVIADNGCHDNSERNESGHGNLSQARLCMVGLHCCGDLTPTMLRHFADLESVRAICCVSCCYHRMTFDNDRNKFENFPMSEAGKMAVSMVTKGNPDWSFTTYSLRLAAQETRARWRDQTAEDHQFHMRNVAFRAVLDVCLAEGDFKLRKTTRKLAHKTDYQSFEKYVDAVTKHVDLGSACKAEEDENERIDQFHSKMMALYKKYEPYFGYVEPFTALQVLFQPVLETFIYADRQRWLSEAGYRSKLVPVFDELLSPRNLAFVALKD